MLIELNIFDFAVVKSLNLDFSENMSVITGETGAGKSIILDALGLALGARADSQWVRPNCEKADINACFDISKIPAAILWLTDSELLTGEAEQTCLIRRVIYKNGRSKAYINGRPATSTQLKLLGEHLVQIHGQHQHQLLLKPFEQLRILDAFGQHETLLSQVKKTFEEYDCILSEIEHLKLCKEQDPSRLTLLRYQVEELNQLQLQDDEWDQLNAEQTKLSHAQEDLSALDASLTNLTQDSDGGINALQSAQNALTPLLQRHPELAPIIELLKSAQIHADEALGELNHVLQSIDLNPNRLHEVESRLSQIYDIARKHKTEVIDLKNLHVSLSKDLELIQGADQKLAQLEEKKQKAVEQYNKAAKKLSKARIKASTQMGKEIAAWLEPLGIKGGQFEVELKPCGQLSANGLETVQFLVSTNPGHPLSVMQKIVSGGELSRISLAIQLIAATYQSTPVLIFDEVDVGVGGKIGAIIGRALSQLARNVQVLCITHLPQVAAFGDHHYQVIKSHHKQSTTTTIEPLTSKERVEEIARMLGGLDISKQARDNAKVLLKKCESTEPA